MLVTGGTARCDVPSVTAILPLMSPPEMSSSPGDRREIAGGWSGGRRAAVDPLRKERHGYQYDGDREKDWPAFGVEPLSTSEAQTRRHGLGEQLRRGCRHRHPAPLLAGQNQIGPEGLGHVGAGLLAYQHAAQIVPRRQRR
jgi:hypothetical protein